MGNLRYEDGILNIDSVNINSFSEETIDKLRNQLGNSSTGSTVDVTESLSTKELNIIDDSSTIVSTYSVENPEWLSVTLDKDNKIISGIKTDGTTYISSLESSSIDEINRKFSNITPQQLENLNNYDPACGNVLYGKIWYCCGDSFTQGDFSKSDTPESSYHFQEGKYKGLNKVYSRFIALRNNINLKLLGLCGATIGFRKDDKYWNNPSFDVYTDTPYCLSSVSIVESDTISSISLKTPSDENAGCCYFMNNGDNYFTYTSNGWKYDTDTIIYDITKFLNIVGIPSINDRINVIMRSSNSGFYNQFRKIEEGKTTEECKQFTGYITSWFGINDSGKCILGSINDESLNTFYGALNWWALNCITKFPRAHIGYIVTNQCNILFKQAIRDVAQKWGIPYLDMDGDIKIQAVSGYRDDITPNKTINIDSRVKILRWNNNFRVSANNGHPNEFAHEYQSTFIENWLRTL